MSEESKTKNYSKPQWKDTQEYQLKVATVTPKIPIVRNLWWAFVVGGLICASGQCLLNYLLMLGLDHNEASSYTTVILIFCGAFLTGIGVYDQLGKYAGAGAIIPITGFANAIVAPAMEFKREGYIAGIGAKMFIIAGPVLVYGIITAFIMGFIYWARH